MQYVTEWQLEDFVSNDDKDRTQQWWEETIALPLPDGNEPGRDD